MNKNICQAASFCDKLGLLPTTLLPFINERQWIEVMLSLLAIFLHFSYKQLLEMTILWIRKYVISRRYKKVLV